MTQNWLWLALVISQGFLGSGCATRKLWEEKSFCVPKEDPQLRLYLAVRRQDVLVVYDELRERNSAVKRRAFYLNENMERLAEQKKPHFVSLRAAAGLPTVPVVSVDPSTNWSAGLELCARERAEAGSFDLYSRGRLLTNHRLPVYGDGFQQATQVALTPLAVIADVTLVSAVVGFYVWVQSGCWPYSP